MPWDSRKAKLSQCVIKFWRQEIVHYRRVGKKKKAIIVRQGTSWKGGVAWSRPEPEPNPPGPRWGVRIELPVASEDWPPTPTAGTPWTSDPSPRQAESPPGPPIGWRSGGGCRGHRFKFSSELRSTTYLSDENITITKFKFQKQRLDEDY